MVNIYLLLVLFYTSLYAFLRATHTLGIQSVVDQNFLGFKRLSIVNFPLLYLFCRKVLFEAPTKRIVALHFIFPFLFYTTIQIFQAMGLLQTTITTTFYSVFFACSMLYWILSIRLMISHCSWTSFSKLFFGHGGREEVWTFFVLLIWTIVNIRILVILFLDLANVPSIGYENGFWFCALLMVALFVRILGSPGLIFGLDNPGISLPEHQPLKVDHTLSASNRTLDVWNMDMTPIFSNRQDERLSIKVRESLREIILKIEHEVLQNHFFRNAKSDLNLLSYSTKLPKSHLTYVFKYHCSMYFQDFKKFVQIRDAVQLIERGFLSDNTLEALSIKVGFSSYNPFFTAFKKNMGMSPQHYVSQNIYNNARFVSIIEG